MIGSVGLGFHPVPQLFQPAAGEEAVKELSYWVVAQDKEDDHRHSQGVQRGKRSGQTEVVHELHREGVKKIDRQGVLADGAHHRDLSVQQGAEDQQEEEQPQEGQYLDQKLGDDVDAQFFKGVGTVEGCLGKLAEEEQIYRSRQNPQGQEKLYGAVPEGPDLSLPVPGVVAQGKEGQEGEPSPPRSTGRWSLR